VTVFTVRVGEHNFIVLTYLLTYIRGPCATWTPPSGKIIVPEASTFTTSNCVFNFNFLAPVVSKVIWASQICIKGPCAPRTPLAEKILTQPIPPSTCLYLYNSAVKFQLRSSVNVRLTKWGLGDFGGRGKDIWWESTSVLRIARFQTSLVQI